MPDATRENGEVTLAPLAGLLTVTFVVVEAGTPVEVGFTVTVTLVTQEAPWFPHDLTCRTWAPRGAVTGARTEAPETKVVLVLLSRE